MANSTTNIDYENFKILIKTERLDSTKYYKELVRFKDDIILDIAYRNQKEVATDLNLHQSKLSTIVNILKVL